MHVCMFFHTHHIYIILVCFVTTPLFNASRPFKRRNLRTWDGWMTWLNLALDASTSWARWGPRLGGQAVEGVKGNCCPLVN